MKGDMENEDRRRYERFATDETYVAVRIDPRFRLLDVSESGLAFHSDHPFTPGSVITIDYAPDLKVECLVVECRMVEVNNALLETAYHVRCSIADTAKGAEIVTRAHNVPLN